MKNFRLFVGTMVSLFLLVCGAVAIFMFLSVIWLLAIPILLFVIFVVWVSFKSNVRFTVTQDGKRIGTYTRKGGFKRD